MATRLDELHGYQFMQERVVQALTRHDPDPSGRAPVRTLTLALVSLVIAALIAVGFLVVGALTGRGGPSSLRDASTVLIEKETGAQWVFTEGDGQLHPVLNYTSGLLLTNGNGGSATTVRHNRLAELRRSSGVPTGATLGIADAPDSLPSSGDLLREPWQVCTGTDSAAPRTQLFVGADGVSGGRALAGPAGTKAGEALLVRAPDDRVYLVVPNRKHLISDPAVTLAAFGWTGRQRQPVAAAWLNALASGPDITTPAVTGLGDDSNAVPDVIGRLIRAPGPAGDQWALVRRDDVLPITDVQAQLLLADPDTNVGEPREVGTSDFAKLPFASSSATPADGLPAAVPTLVSVASQVCVRVPDATAGANAILVDPTATATAAAPPPSTKPDDTGRAAVDRVSVPAGHGVLVRSVANSGAPATSGAVSIVTDAGVRYAISDPDALAKLGYRASTPQPMPASLVSLVPPGPALSTEAARKVW